MLVGPTTRRVAIVGGTRIPFARSHGAYAGTDNQEFADRGAVLAGRALCPQAKASGMSSAARWSSTARDFNLTRESVLSRGLDPQTPGLDLQRACGTGLEAAILVANKIALGQIDAGIAGGVRPQSTRRWYTRAPFST